MPINAQQDIPHHKQYSFARYIITLLLGKKYAKNRYEEYLAECSNRYPDHYGFAKPVTGSEKDIRATIYSNQIEYSAASARLITLADKEHYQKAVEVTKFNDNARTFNLIASLASHGLLYIVFVFLPTALWVAGGDDSLGINFVVAFLINFALVLLYALILSETYYVNDHHPYKKTIPVAKKGSPIDDLLRVSPLFDMRAKLSEDTPQEIQDAYWEKHKEHYKEVLYFADLIDGLKDYDQIIEVKKHIRQRGEDHLEDLESLVNLYGDMDAAYSSVRQESKSKIINEEIKSYQISRGRDVT